VHSPTKRTYLCAKLCPSKIEYYFWFYRGKDQPRKSEMNTFCSFLWFNDIHTPVNVLGWVVIGALTILPTIYASNGSRHKSAGHKKCDQVMLSTSMLKQIQKSEKSIIKVKII
jgi:hypothetical protein